MDSAANGKIALLTDGLSRLEITADTVVWWGFQGTHITHIGYIDPIGEVHVAHNLFDKGHSTFSSIAEKVVVITLS